MANVESDTIHVYRLSAAGMLRHSDAWLYYDPNTPGCLGAVAFLGLYVPSLFLSYLKVSRDGLELHYWPAYRVRATWEEIERLGTCKYHGVFPCDALFLKQPGSDAQEVADHGQGLFHRRLIPVGDFRGWPKGGLSDDLRRYIPHVFSKDAGHRSAIGAG